MKQAITLVLLLSLSLSHVCAQSLRELQEQRKKTEASIALTNKLLNSNSKSKNQELSNIKLLSRKINYRKSLISNIEKENKSLEKLIYEKEITIESYSQDLAEMKDNYAELLQYMWTRRSSHDQLMYVLAGEDIAQIYRRFRYMSEFSAHQKSQALAIQDMNTRLVLEKDSLSAKKEQQTRLLTKYDKETKQLDAEQKSKSKKVDNLKSKERELKKQLAEQQKKRDKLKKFVDNLIAEEAKKAAKDASGKLKLTPEQKLTSSKFVGNKGKLPWPVSSGIVVEKYGQHTHEVYSRVKVQNDGIDIRTEKGGNARSIFDGKVISINALPGYNKGIIIQHGEYYTFYANLTQVYVKKGDQVSTKQKIGKVFTDSKGASTIHFQVWKGMNKQNPQHWISK